MNPELSQVAAKFFKLSLPTTSDELKSAFRREALIHHPDRGGDSAYFVKMKKAYDALSEAPEVLVSTAAKEVPMTIDGVLLTELGLGVDGGTDCTTCDTKGYTTIEDWSRILCPTCRGYGFTILCPACSGRSSKCRKCGGAGVLGVSSVSLGGSVNWCATCRGMGGFKPTKPTFRHYKCGDCEGKGQSPMFNPLWPKNRVAR